jgi:hypothetical protein
MSLKSGAVALGMPAPRYQRRLSLATVGDRFRILQGWVRLVKIFCNLTGCPSVGAEDPRPALNETLYAFLKETKKWGDPVRSFEAQRTRQMALVAICNRLFV